MVGLVTFPISILLTRCNINIFNQGFARIKQKNTTAAMNKRVWTNSIVKFIIESYLNLRGGKTIEEPFSFARNKLSVNVNLTTHSCY